MRKLLFLICLLLTLPVLQAKVVEVAGWGVFALGGERNHLQKIDGEAVATLVVKDGSVLFSLWSTDTKELLGPSFLIENLYLDQSAAESSSFIGMKSVVYVLGQDGRKGKRGRLYLRVVL